MAKFDPTKADLNKDGKLSSYERKRGEATASAMQMGYAMKMGKNSSKNTEGAFKVKDEAMLMSSPILQTELTPGMQGYFKQESRKGRDADSIRSDMQQPQIRVPQSNFQTNYEITEALFPGTVSDSNLLGSMDTSAYNVSRGSTVGPLDRKPVRRDDGTVTYTYGGKQKNTAKDIVNKTEKRKPASPLDSFKTSGVDTSGTEKFPSAKQGPKTTTSKTSKPASETKRKENLLSPYDTRQNIRRVKVAEREVRRQMRKARKGKAVAGGYEAAVSNLKNAQRQLATASKPGPFQMRSAIAPTMFKSKKYKK